ESKPQEWFFSGFGRQVLAQERRYCRTMAADAFGYYALQMGHSARRLLSGAPVRHSAIVGLDGECDITADWTALPFASESVDFILLAHALEASRAPHAVLREAARVLRPQGRLLIVGFNPWSLLGTPLSSLPWRGRWLSLLRVKDWLKLLDMAAAEGRFAVFMPPHESRRARRRLGWLEKAGRRWWPLGGGVYFLSAVKRTPGARLVRRLRYPFPAWPAAKARR
ncbi:MAG: class I SAM-dependent methyltransferase, partial [Gammaproteobacteria bacterium]